MNKFKLGCLSLVLVAGLVQASDTKYYVGVSAGQVDGDSGLTPTATQTFDEKDTGYKVYGGYQFNKYLAAELYYADLGTSTYTDSASALDLKADFKSYGISAVASYPVHKNVEPFVKLGMQHWDAKATGTDANNKAAQIEGDGNKPVYGLGINFPVTESFAFRTEYEVIKIDTEQATFLSAGLIYKF